ncbi:hypothetical protein [Candidatus Azobacteroides pseudotrichonymphae]|uniref:hypothetical protein n=1 Tax=Candidatus Azobacteroides pseudotrichonymphae TaxID=511435 RepID=UPI00059F3377|nr:hypothetical protein [Candidatus Azobacteroides pseudotrichonymphae]
MESISVWQKDLFWTYAVVFLQVGSNVILLPFILRTFPQEIVGIWAIFSTIVGSTTELLDFGFNTSFTRSVFYIFSGAKTLKKNRILSCRKYFRNRLQSFEGTN